MAEQTPMETNPAKVRIGLGLLALVIIVAVGMIAVIDSAVGKAIMFAIAATVFVRAFLLYRSLRRDQRPPG
jgi:hypothetical protein